MNNSRPEDTTAIQAPPRLTDEQILSLTARMRDALQRQTNSPEEAASIALACVATFCIDFKDGSIEAMAKELQKAKNRIVSDFRTGRLVMRKAQS